MIKKKSVLYVFSMNHNLTKTVVYEFFFQIYLNVWFFLFFLLLNANKTTSTNFNSFLSGHFFSLSLYLSPSSDLLTFKSFKICSFLMIYDKESQSIDDDGKHLDLQILIYSWNLQFYNYQLLLSHPRNTFELFFSFHSWFCSFIFSSSTQFSDCFWYGVPFWRAGMHSEFSNFRASITFLHFDKIKASIRERKSEDSPTDIG